MMFVYRVSVLLGNASGEASKREDVLDCVFWRRRGKGMAGEPGVK